MVQRLHFAHQLEVFPETDEQVNIEECIKNEIQKKLDCIIPNLTTGDVIAPDGKLNNAVCSNDKDYMNYKQLYGREMLNTWPTEAAIAKELGCIANCQEGNWREMNMHTQQFPLVYYLKIKR